MRAYMHTYMHTYIHLECKATDAEKKTKGCKTQLFVKDDEEALEHDKLVFYSPFGHLA